MRNKIQIETIRFSFIQTIPVLLGYLFLGIAYGLSLQAAGYSVWWAFMTSTVIYAGSMQFVLVTLLTGGTSLLHAAMMTFFINGRHLFYGLSFVDKFKKAGKAYPYLVFSLTDETYSVLCGCRIPSRMKESSVMFYIALFDQCYWVLGSVLGAWLGSVLAFDSTGVDFSMTALFVVILINQLQEKNARLPAIIGLAASVCFLLILGPDRFLLPALTLSVAILLGLRGRTVVV